VADVKGPIRSGLQRSIFLKLFLVYLATTVALILGVWGTSHLILHNDPMFKQTRGRMMANYLLRLIDEIGQPPSQERGMRLAEELGMEIRVESPHTTWATDPTLPPTSALSVGHTHSNPDRRVGRYHGRLFVMMERGPTRYLFFLPGPPMLDAEEIAVIVGIIALILAGSYAVVRWLFRPLSWLTQGVAQITAGNLSHRVPIRSRDQLGELTGAINNMAARIREMLQARNRLLLDVSHELRSPLTRMKVALEFVGEEAVKERLQQEIRELEAMVTELLEAERLNSDHGGLILSETDVIPLVRELAESYNGHGPGVRVANLPSTLLVTVDRDRFRMAVRNVLENAVNHSVGGLGPVELRVEATAGKAVQVSVKDHGPGIPPEEHGRIFEPFYRVDKSRARATGGYGLGLSLAKTIMIAHGGDILLTSEPGKGSTFILTLPVVSHT
jgi:signal transduction histidine kinase